jgi:hypothetical protein
MPIVSMDNPLSLQSAPELLAKNWDTTCTFKILRQNGPHDAKHLCYRNYGSCDALWPRPPNSFLQGLKGVIHSLTLPAASEPREFPPKKW